MINANWYTNYTVYNVYYEPTIYNVIKTILFSNLGKKPGKNILNLCKFFSI